MASIREVADHAGVSPATVSRTFTNPELLNEATRERVREAASRLGYSPRPYLRPSRIPSRSQDAAPYEKTDSAGATFGAIGFEFFCAKAGDSLLANDFYGPVLAGAQAEADAHGLHVLIHSTDRHAFDVDLPRMIQDRAISGLLLVGTTDPVVINTFALHVPDIVLVDNRDDLGRLECVVSDSVGGAFAATKHLIALGHRRIAFVMPNSTVASFRDRMRGWTAACFESGISPDPELVIGYHGDVLGDELIRQLRNLLTQPDRPTAILTANDYFAIVAWRQCRELGLRVPEDISLVGFDDVAFSQSTDPPLTTVRVDKEFMGRLAVRRLFVQLTRRGEGRQIADEPSACHQVPSSLVVRGSSGPPRS